MLSAREIIDIYISFFEKQGHKRISNSPLVPENDPTTLFTSSGMQPLVPYLLGEPHPAGTRLVEVGPIGMLPRVRREEEARVRTRHPRPA